MHEEEKDAHGLLEKSGYPLGSSFRYQTLPLQRRAGHTSPRTSTDGDSGENLVPESPKQVETTGHRCGRRHLRTQRSYPVPNRPTWSPRTPTDPHLLPGEKRTSEFTIPVNVNMRLTLMIYYSSHDGRDGRGMERHHGSVCLRIYFLL